MKAFACLLTLGGALALDSSLHRSFFGMAYSSDGVILPNCGANQSDVTADIDLIAQLTPRLRLYGSDCNQTALVMEAIKETNADLTVWPCIFIGVPYNQSVVDRQFQAVASAFTTYGVSNIGGLTVGNEFLLDSYGDSGLPTDAAGVAARTQLLSAIKSINASVQAMNLGKAIPIGTSDAGSAITLELMEGVDYFMANDHPWFGGVPIDQAAGWTWQFLQTNDVAVANQAANKPVVYIGETGWPTASDNASEASDGPSVASVANLQTFLDTFVCQANTNETGYFFFEFKDEPWTEIYGGVEPHWGLFNDDKTLKSGLKIPTCLASSPDNGTVSQITSPTGSSPGSGGSSSNASKSSASSNYALPSFLTLALASVASVAWFAM